MTIIITPCTTDAQLISTLPLMQQLGRDIPSDTTHYLSQLRTLIDDGYHITGAFKEKKCVGCISYRFQKNLWLKEYLYIEDLVIDEKHRSQKIGKQLNDWLEKEAKQKSYYYLTLASGMHRPDAHRFYEREGYQKALYFWKNISDN